mgnify:CR=1 FL=1
MNYFHNITTITYMQQQNEEILTLFGKTVSKIRKSKSKSLNKFAFEKGGITSATLSRIENGIVDFKFTTLVKLACALDISLEDLFKDFEYNYTIDE